MLDREKEQERVEELFAEDSRAYEERRRRQICIEWIQYHQHLRDVFRSHVDHHTRERERYEGLLRDMHTTTEGAA